MYDYRERTGEYNPGAGGGLLGARIDQVYTVRPGEWALKKP